MAEMTLTAPTAAPAPPTQRLTSIMSVATELPATRLTNAEVAEMAGVSEEWIVSRTGIRERRRALTRRATERLRARRRAPAHLSGPGSAPRTWIWSSSER